MGKGTGRGGDNAVGETKSSKIRPEKMGKVNYIGKVSMDEIKKHRTPGDAWLLVKGKVYDVSGWHDHPGGNVIFTTVGEDATDVFTAFHAGTSFQFLKEFEIGEVDYEKTSDKLRPTQKQVEFEAAYRRLRVKLFQEGMFDASMPYYTFKMLSQVLIWALGWWLAQKAGGSWALVTLSALAYSIFLQQSGWLAHDILHHQVFKNRTAGHLWGIVWGNFAQGFSISWWMDKHNSHHAVPNLVESCAHAADGDPDIDTMPFLAWSRQMFMQREEALKSCSFGRFMIRNQQNLYFILLGFARMSWAFQGLTQVFPALPTFGWAVKASEMTGNKAIKYLFLERLGLILHHIWFLAAGFNVFWSAYSAGSPVIGLVQWLYWVFATNVFTGLLLAVVFGLGHNGMAVYHADSRPDFWTLQVTTTRNVVGGRSWMEPPQWFVDWICGGLQYQVEHHLFPMVPRNRLGRVHREVVKFCKEEGVSYHEAGIGDGTVEVLQHLQKVALEFEQQFPAL